MPTQCPRCDQSGLGCSTLAGGLTLCRFPDPIAGWVPPGTHPRVYCRGEGAPAELPAPAPMATQPAAMATDAAKVTETAPQPVEPVIAAPVALDMIPPKVEPDPQAIEHLRRWLERRGGKATARQLQRARGRAYPTAQLAEAALDHLATLGLAESSTFTPQGGGWTVRWFALAKTSVAERVAILREVEVGTS